MRNGLIQLWEVRLMLNVNVRIVLMYNTIISFKDGVNGVVVEVFGHKILTYLHYGFPGSIFSHQPVCGTPLPPTLPVSRELSSHLFVAARDVLTSLAELAWKSSLSDAIGSSVLLLLKPAKPNRQPSCMTQWGPAVYWAIFPLSLLFFILGISILIGTFTDRYLNSVFFHSKQVLKRFKGQVGVCTAIFAFAYCVCLGISSGMFANCVWRPHLSTQK